MHWAVTNHQVLADLTNRRTAIAQSSCAAGGEVVGCVGLVPMLAPFDQVEGGPAGAPFSAEVGLYWALAEAHRGHGLATEAARALVVAAFRQFHLRSVVATTEAANTASRPSCAVSACVSSATRTASRRGSRRRLPRRPARRRRANFAARYGTSHVTVRVPSVRRAHVRRSVPGTERARDEPYAFGDGRAGEERRGTAGCSRSCSIGLL